MWKQKIKVVQGRIGKTMEIIFIYDGTLPDIKHIGSSCGCSKPKRVGDTIVVRYKPGHMPKHLVGSKFYRTTKTIKVFYKDGRTDSLAFTAKILV